VLLVAGGATAAFLLLGDDDDEKTASEETSQTSQASESPSDASASPSSVETSSSAPTESSTPPSESAPPATSPKDTAEAYLDAFLSGDCPTLQVASTPEHFATDYKTISKCQRQLATTGMADVDTTYDEPVVNGTTATLTALAHDNFDDSEYALTWELEESAGSWLVSSFLVELA